MEILEFTADRVVLDDNEHFVAAAITHTGSGRYFELRRSTDHGGEQDWGIFAEVDGSLSRIGQCVVTRQSLYVALHTTAAFYHSYQAICVHISVDDIQFQHYATMLTRVFLGHENLLELSLDDASLALLYDAPRPRPRLQFSLARMLMSFLLASLAFATASVVLDSARSAAHQRGVLPHELGGADYVWAAWPLLSLLAAAAGLLVKGSWGALRWGFAVGVFWGAILLLRRMALGAPP